MKRLRFLLCILTAYMLISFAGFGFEKSVTFVTDYEKNGGFLVEITKAAFEKVGYKVNIEYLPWIRALNYVMEGKSEALLGAYYSDERASKMYYSDVMGESSLVFFKLKGEKIVYSKIEDLEPYKIGVIRGAIYTPEFDSAEYLLKEVSPDYLVNIMKLETGRIDLMLEKKYVVLNTLKTKYPELNKKVEYMDKPLKEIRFYNCFSKKNKDAPEKLKEFNRGLKLIMEDGTYSKIMDKGLHE